MRRPRFKPDDRPMFYHVFNRVAGEPADFPFGYREKEFFIRLLHKLNAFYSVKVVAYQTMSNHFHMVIHAPAEPPTPKEVCARYNAYHKGRRTLTPDDSRCAKIGARMRDISHYMQTLEQEFARWYNRTRKTRRRGHVWAERFKHTLLGSAHAVLECCKYLEMNPVRAGIARNPADWRFSSYGAWCGTGHHPFEANIKAVLLPFLAVDYPFETPDDLRAALKESFSSAKAEKSEARETEFTTAIHRRVRYWADGLVIGSELFLLEMVSRSQGILRARVRGFVKARAPDDSPLYCYKQLRTT